MIIEYFLRTKATILDWTMQNQQEFGIKEQQRHQ